MPLLIPALGGALVVAGLIGLILGVRRIPATGPAPRRPVQSRLGARVSHMDRRTKILILAGFVLGVIIYLVTGWLIAVALVPLAKSVIKDVARALEVPFNDINTITKLLPNVVARSIRCVSPPLKVLLLRSRVR